MQLFENCYELTPAFSKFLQRPDKLQLVQNENYPATRDLGVEGVQGVFEVHDVVHMGQIVNPAAPSNMLAGNEAQKDDERHEGHDAIMADADRQEAH